MEKQHRILWPWLGISLGLIAITILLRGEYQRSGNIKKIMATIIAAICFLFGYFVLKNIVSQRIDLVFVIYGYIMSSLVVFFTLNTVKSRLL